MNPEAPSLDGQALAARYEALRQDVMSSGGCRHTICGLALFMRQGMAAWMKSPAETPVRQAAVPPAAPAMRMPDGVERNLVDIIAAMALATTLEGAR
jgi:hypothetical protein